MDQENLEKAQTAIKSLLEVIEHSSPDGKEVAYALSTEMDKLHRTHQQTFMRELYSFFINYAGSGYDARNEAAVKFAQDVKNIDPMFPYI